MPESPSTILNRDQAAALRAQHGQRRRINWAFGKGGTYDVVLFGNGALAAIVDEPAKLDDQQKKEIATALAKSSKAPQAGPAQAPASATPDPKQS